MEEEQIKEIITLIDDTIWDEEDIDFTGIIGGDYSINEIKGMIVDSLINAIKIRKGEELKNDRGDDSGKYEGDSNGIK